MIEPKLLGRVNSTLSSSGSPGASAAFDMKSNITSYAFLDDGPKVRLYVDLPGIQDACTAGSKNGVGDDDETGAPAKVDLEWSKTSMCLLVKNYPRAGEERCLSFGRLHGEIEKGMVKIKKERLVVTLVKKGKKVEPKEEGDDGGEDSNNAAAGDDDESQPKEPEYDEWPTIAAKD